jgi:PST family polysaccharide transporter
MRRRIERVMARIGGGDRLARNIGWYGVAELFVRVSRLVTTVVLARLLLPEEYGLAASALVAFELVRLLANNGVGLMIVRAAPADVDAACETAYRISRMVVAAMVVLQVGAGLALASAMDRVEVAAMLGLLAISYLALPLTEVRWCRMLRDQRVTTLAGISAVQVLLDNGATALLALAGAGAWAVVLPKLLTAPVYVWMIVRAEPWVRRRGVACLPAGEVRRFALPVLATEALNALRLHVDKVLVGASLGLASLGTYAFAFNAGLGLSMAVTAAVSVTLFPHLAEVAEDRAEMLRRFDQAIAGSVASAAALIAAKAAAALLYVPIVFGARWADAAPLVALLCLSAAARPLFDAAAQLLRARGETRHEVMGQAVVTALVLGAFALGLPFGLWTAVGLLTIASLTAHVAFAVAVRWHAGHDAAHPAEVAS